MREIPSPDTLSRIRTIGILAHVDAGKTSITERLLHVAGLRCKAGDVDEGNTATDYLAVERSHGITVKAAAVRFDWNNLHFNLIDTPGHVDFGTEVDRALRVLDGAVIALCAVSGVQARTEAILRAGAERNLPRICFVNKMDRRGADFFRVVEDLQAKLVPEALAVQIPWLEHGLWRGVIDLVRMEAFPATDADARAVDDAAPGAAHNNGAHRGMAIPEDCRAAASQARALLVEAAAEHDSTIMEDFVAGREPDAARLRAALSQATRQRALVPVLCGSAFSDDSALHILEAVGAYLPSPREAACPQGKNPDTAAMLSREGRQDEPFSAFVFKTQGDSEGNIVFWTRIWSGSIVSGARVLEARSGRFVKVRRIFGIQADKMEAFERACAGDIVALSLLQDSASGQGRSQAGRAGALAGTLTGTLAGDAGFSPCEAGASLCDPAFPIVYEALLPPVAVLSLVLEPASGSDTAALREALAILASSDAALRVRDDKDTGRIEIAGLGELHLDITVERLRREYNIKLRTGQPRVSCKEAPSRVASGVEDFDRDMGGERIRAFVSVQIGPERDTRAAVLCAPGLKLAPALGAAVQRGAASALWVGPVEGWPVEDALVTVTALQSPSGQSRSAITAVEAATAMAVRKALAAADCRVIEPVMRLDLETPEEYFGAVLAELKNRQARIESVDDIPGGKTIVAMARQRVLFGFAASLRSASAGRAGFQSRLARYEACVQESHAQKRI